MHFRLISQLGKQCVHIIDYRAVKLVVFQCPRVACKRETLFCFPALKRGVNIGMKSWEKNTYVIKLNDRKASVVPISQKYYRYETLQPGEEFDDLKPGLKRGILKCISSLNSLFLLWVGERFLKEGIKTYLTEPMSSLTSPTIFLSSNLYSVVQTRMHVCNVCRLVLFSFQMHRH